MERRHLVLAIAATVAVTVAVPAVGGSGKKPLTKQEVKKIATKLDEKAIKSIPAGPKGDRGAKGDPGPQGDQGQQGIQGPPGPGTIVSANITGASDNFLVLPGLGRMKAGCRLPGDENLKRVDFENQSSGQVNVVVDYQVAGTVQPTGIVTVFPTAETGVGENPAAASYRFLIVDKNTPSTSALVSGGWVTDADNCRHWAQAIVEP